MEFWPRSNELPPFLQRTGVLLAASLRSHPVFDDCHQSRPSPSTFPLTPFAEVDDVTVMTMSRACAYLFASDVGEDDFAVARIALNQPLHLGER